MVDGERLDLGIPGICDAMNVRVVPRKWPKRTDLYGGVERVIARNRDFLLLLASNDSVLIPFADVAEIFLDAEPGDWW